MTNGQRKVLIAGVIAFVLTCIVPPWRNAVVTTEEASRRAMAIALPQSSQDEYERSNRLYIAQLLNDSGRISMSPINDAPPNSSVAFDVLSVEWLAVLVATGVAVAALRPR